MDLLRRRISPQVCILAGILVVALVFRLWGIGWGLYNADVTRRTHPDEWTIYYLFQWFRAYHSLNPCPRAHGQCFLDWGTTFPYLTYAVHFLLYPIFGLLPRHLFGPRADMSFIQPVLAGRLVSAATSTLTVYVAYRIGKVGYSTAAGLLAALLVALSGLLIQLAHFATPDSTTGLFLALTLLGAVAALRAPRFRTWALTGAAMGAATASEFHMALLAIPITTAWLLTRPHVRSYFAGSLGIAVAVFLAIFMYGVIDLPSFIAAFEHTVRIRSVDSGIQYQDRWAPYQPAWLYVVRYPLGYGVGFPLAAWMLAGFGFALFRRMRADWVLLSWVVPYFLLVTAEPAKFMRYSAPLLVPLAILAARVAVELWEVRTRVARFALIAVGAASLAFTGIYDSAYTGLFASTDPRAVASSYIASHSQGRTYVAYEVLPDGLVNGADFMPNRVKPCIAQLQSKNVRGAAYIELDGYTREELSTAELAQQKAFRQALRTGASFQVVEHLHYVPTFLGLSFPIDGSPHDWRYPSHEITVYRRLHVSPDPGPYCFKSIRAAAKALYVPPDERGASPRDLIRPAA